MGASAALRGLAIGRPIGRRSVSSPRLAIAAVLALIAVRFALVVTWHQTAGDGLQYYQLATQLRTERTFAFDDGKPTYARLPGYPLFLAFIAQPLHSVSINRHVRSATLANVILDLLSAVLLWRAACLLQLWRPKGVGIALLLIPTLWLMSCYAMTESLSTTAAAAELYLAVRILLAPRLAWVVTAGVVAGLAQLTRLDAICTLPMVAYACASAYATSVIRRAGFVAAFLLVAAAVFSPWPIRNVLRFGQPHFAASTSRTLSGRPFGDGLYAWARTWADSDGDSFFELYFVYDTPFGTERPGVVPKKSYDDEQERQQIVSLMSKFKSEGPSDSVEQGFRDLARARFRKHPFRTIFVLPVKRIFHVLSPEPSYEMPMEVHWLGLPFLRPLFGVVDCLLYLLGCIGAAIAWRRRRALFWLVVPAVLLRLALYGFAIPHAATHRFLVEAFPLLLILAAYAATEIVRPETLVP
jgi:hypothetical protein